MSRRFRLRLLAAALAVIALWVVFFDSHSVVRRVAYAQEVQRVEEANRELQAENEALHASLDRGLDVETVERVAREQYGMRRPGEMVYRVVAPHVE